MQAIDIFLAMYAAKHTFANRILQDTARSPCMRNRHMRMPNGITMMGIGIVVTTYFRDAPHWEGNTGVEHCYFKIPWDLFIGIKVFFVSLLSPWCVWWCSTRKH